MAYIIWPLIGIVIATAMGTGLRRRAFRPNANASFLAGAFGALIGGVIGDGVLNARSGQISLTSLLGAVVGALIFCWAVRDSASDTEG